MLRLNFSKFFSLEKCRIPHCFESQFSLLHAAKRKMQSSSYESAVCLINNLQSNANILAKLRAERERFPEKNVLETEKYLKRTGILVSDLDKLNIIHVTGTKGKGSTCALVESILRQHGFKTGFYSSPHLVHVRERIRINGSSLSEEVFAKYFHKVYNSLKFAAETIEDGQMPAYFKFLTVMAFNVFLAENVDIAIIEVGIGGTYDCTNVINKPVVCGITTLDLDHMSILGNTLEEIAWQKAGICKPASVCLTVPQPLSALAVLSKRAEELSCPIYLVPGVDEYRWPDDEVKCGIPGKQQYWNITLAVQLAKIWLESMKGENVDSTFDCIERWFKFNDKKTETVHKLPVLSGFKVWKPFVKGIESCRWPGRSHILKREKVTYYLDGAHTPKSIQYCSEWFLSASEAETEILGVQPVKILLFHCTADRNPETLLSFLIGCDFDCAIFCPTSVHNRLDPRSDQSNFTSSRESEFKKVLRNQSIWTNMQEKAKRRGPSASRLQQKTAAAAAAAETGACVLSQGGCVEVGNGQELNLLESAELSDRNGVKPMNPDEDLSLVFHCIEDAVNWINYCDLTTVRCVNDRIRRVQVLVTGSLHLVGGVLGLVDLDMEL